MNDMVVALQEQCTVVLRVFVLVSCFHHSKSEIIQVASDSERHSSCEVTCICLFFGHCVVFYWPKKVKSEGQKKCEK